MMTLVLLCLSVLDFQRPPIPDSIEKQFVVTELVDQSITGCATLPQAGNGPINHHIAIDYVNHTEPLENPTPLSVLTTDSTRADIDAPMVQAMLPYDPPNSEEKPFSEKSPVAVVPEPPTAAILTVSAVVLLFLLFGRRKKERLYRRT